MIAGMDMLACVTNDDLIGALIIALLLIAIIVFARRL